MSVRSNWVPNHRSRRRYRAVDFPTLAHQPCTRSRRNLLHRLGQRDPASQNEVCAPLIEQTQRGSVLRNQHHYGTRASCGDRNSSTRWSSVSRELHAQWTKAPPSGFLCKESNRPRGRTKTSQRCTLHRARSSSPRNGRADREWCSRSGGACREHSKVGEHQLDLWPKAKICRLGPIGREPSRQ